jgi:hypothetical protein
MSCFNKDDLLFSKLATDTVKAEKHLDYLTGKRTCFQHAALACLMIAVGARVIAQTESLPGLHIPMYLFGFFFLMCAGIWTTTDAHIKALILFIHSKNNDTAN